MNFKLGEILIFLGLFLIFLGFFFISGLKPLGKLPGDIYIEKESFKFYFPLTTCLLISIILSLIFISFFEVFEIKFNLL